jgi:Thioredoxin
VRTDPAPGASPWATTGLEVLHRTDFSDSRLNRPETYVVCFGAAWCPITRRFMPNFLALKDRIPATLAIADITDLQEPLWDDFRIRITPSIIVFRDGEILLRLDGRRFFGITKSELAKLQRALATPATPS